MCTSKRVNDKKQNKVVEADNRKKRALGDKSTFSSSHPKEPQLSYTWTDDEGDNVVKGSLDPNMVKKMRDQDDEYISTKTDEDEFMYDDEKPCYKPKKTLEILLKLGCVMIVWDETCMYFTLRE
uniref:Uncharacterized protein n=1 Tax=Solanum tuberosum TaxID=4113 RepID=M1DT97_SOLTU